MLSSIQLYRILHDVLATYGHKTLQVIMTYVLYMCKTIEWETSFPPLPYPTRPMSFGLVLKAACTSRPKCRNKSRVVRNAITERWVCVREDDYGACDDDRCREITAAAPTSFCPRQHRSKCLPSGRRYKLLFVPSDT